MHYQENETVELKATVVEDIKKEIIAFANCNGGRLYVGVGDDGTVIGLEDADGAALQISNMIRDSIKPDITMFLHYETIVDDGKNIIVVEVQRGTDRPYYLAKKGMRPEGVYVRQGYSSVPATDTAIRHMIKETDGDRFEVMRSLNQELTFEALRQEFKLRNVDLGTLHMHTLKLIDNDGLYSNLALLLSDQCRQSIKAAIFQGQNQSIFKDRREFTGSLLQQMNEVYDFIDFHNRTHATIERLHRIDVRDYPEVAVREALLNMLVHRDYSISASALISMYEDRIEFVSVGGLLPEIELEDIMAGLSVCRNQELANVFYRLHLIEAYGTGISKIMKAYADEAKKPVISTTKNTFKIILPNINANGEQLKFGFREDSLPQHKPTALSTSLKADCSDNNRKSLVIEYIKEHNTITRLQAEKLLDVSSATASRLLRKMVSDGNLIQEGRARDIRYRMMQ